MRNAKLDATLARLIRFAGFQRAAHLCRHHSAFSIT
jgi:hypothetical protein